MFVPSATRFEGYNNLPAGLESKSSGRSSYSLFRYRSKHATLDRALKSNMLRSGSVIVSTLIPMFWGTPYGVCMKLALPELQPKDDHCTPTSDMPIQGFHSCFWKLTSHVDDSNAYLIQVLRMRVCFASMRDALSVALGESNLLG
jgi:hypothetical protein